MSEVRDGICIIDAMNGIDCASPQIGQFTDNFDRVKFLFGKDFSDYTMMIITDINGHVEVVSTDGENLIKETIDGETNLLWNIGINITSFSGVIVYQIAAYKRDGDAIKETWYSKEGRLIVTESISTNEYSTALLGSYPNLLTRLLTEADNLKSDLTDIRQNKVDVKEGFELSENSFSNAEKEKLSRIEDGAEINVISDWEETDENSDRFIKNKPSLSKVALSGTFGDLKGKPVVDIVYDGESNNAQSGFAVKTAIENLVSSAPDALNTLYKLSKAIGNDPAFSQNVSVKLDKKVDKEDGKELSSNDYTDSEKSKLATIEKGAEKNVMSDWSETDANSDKYIKNKPKLSSVALSGSYNDLSDKPHIPSIKGLASEGYVDAGLVEKVDKSVKINGKSLSDDINLTAEDVGALPSDTFIPSVEGLASEEYVDRKVKDIELSSEMNAGFGVPFDKSGTGIVTVDKVHPKEHDVEVTTDAESVTVYGENLIPYPYYQMNKETDGGITFTVNEDGSVVANGTATAQSYIIISRKDDLKLPNGTYYLSGASSEGNEDHKCYISYAGKNQDGRSNETIIEISDSTQQNFMTCVVSAGKTVENFVFRPMLTDSQGVTYHITGGKAFVKSISPEMNILTSEIGKSINAKGYQDGLAVIDELKQAIISLGGNV